MMKRWTKQAAILGLGMSLLMTAAGCTDNNASNGTGKTVAKGQKVKVETVLLAQADFVKAIGGDKVDVDNLMPLSTNFWQWAPTLAEQKKIEESDVFILNGSNVEDRWYAQTEATVKLKNKDLMILDPSEGLQKDPLEKYNNPDANEEDKKKARTNPWLYMDPANAIKEVDTITSALVKKAPDYADEFKKNAEDYKKKLTDLDKDFADQLSKVKHKEIVSSYPAWHYIAKHYGLKMAVPDGIAINDAPWDDPKEVKDVEEKLKTYDAKVVFFEGEAAPRVKEFLAKNGYVAGPLDPLEGKIDGDPKQRDYVEVMKANLENLVKGLNFDK